MPVEEQIRRGLLVCPESRQPLLMDGGAVRTADARYSYPVHRGVPIFLSSERRLKEFLLQHDQSMKEEYESDAVFHPRRLIDRAFASFGDQRSRLSREVWREMLSRLSDDQLCVSIGGGPRRVHPFFVNLNIEKFENVDVVADPAGTVDSDPGIAPEGAIFWDSRAEWLPPADGLEKFSEYSK